MNLFLRGWSRVLRGPALPGLACLVLAWAGCAHRAPAPGPDRAAELRDGYGIEVVGLRLSGGERLLDFRFRIQDEKLAEPLFADGLNRYLVDESTGLSLTVPTSPKMGSLRTGVPRNGRTAFVLFSNPGGLVKSGGKVTIVLGNLRIEDLTVR